MQITIQGIQIGSIFIHFYGFVLMLGTVLGGVLGTVEAKRRGYDPEIVWDLLVWLIIGGVAGARLWHILTPTPSAIESGRTTLYYLTHPLDAIAIWNGGLGIEGAIAGGLIALYFFARRNRLSLLDWMDIGAPSLALGQAVGRWGNFFNQELYGKPTDLPWKLYIDPAHRLNGYQSVAYYHPLFFYEFVLNLLNMLFLLWVARRFVDKLKKGDLFLLYMVIYPLIRFVLEFLRLDPSYVGGVNINQAIAGVVAVLAVAALIWRHRSGSTAEMAYATVDAEESPEVDEPPAEPEASQPATVETEAPIRRTGVRKTEAKAPVKRRSSPKKAS